jgi:hypothetical protein
LQTKTPLPQSVGLLQVLKSQLAPPPGPRPPPLGSQRNKHWAPLAQLMLLQSPAPRQSISQVELASQLARHCTADPQATLQ